MDLAQETIYHPKYSSSPASRICPLRMFLVGFPLHANRCFSCRLLPSTPYRVFICPVSIPHYVSMAAPMLPGCTPCAFGTREVVECQQDSDRLCEPCTECEEGQYESRECQTSGEDRICETCLT